MGWSHRRRLTASHTINAVIEQHNSEVNIAAAAMNEVIATDSGTVAITCDNNNIKLRICQLNTSSKRNSTAMGGVQSIKIHVSGGSGRAADT